jgi:hypothetical protein
VEAAGAVELAEEQAADRVVAVVDLAGQEAAP